MLPILLWLGVKLLLLCCLTNWQHLIQLGTLLNCLSSWFGVGGVVLYGSSPTSPIICSVLKLALSCLMQRSLCLVCLRALSLVQNPFSLYIPLSKVIQNYPGIGFHFYADYMQLYVHLTHMNVTHAFDRLKTYLDDIKKWLSANKLRLNPDKTELIIFGSRIREKLKTSF